MSCRYDFQILVSGPRAPEAMRAVQDLWSGELRECPWPNIDGMDLAVQTDDRSWNELESEMSQVSREFPDCRFVVDGEGTHNASGRSVHYFANGAHRHEYEETWCPPDPEDVFAELGQ